MSNNINPGEAPKVGKSTPQGENVQNPDNTLLQSLKNPNDLSQCNIAFPYSQIFGAGMHMIFSTAGIEISPNTTEKEFRAKLAEALSRVTNQGITEERVNALNQFIDGLEAGNFPQGSQGDGRTQFWYLTNLWKTAGGAIIPQTDNNPTKPKQ